MKKLSEKIDPKKNSQKKWARFWLPKIGVFFLSFLITSVLLLVERQTGVGDRQFKIGEPAPRTLFSPIEIVFEDEYATDALRRNVSTAVLLVYEIDPVTLQISNQKINQFFDEILRVKKNAVEGIKPVFGELPFKLSEGSLNYYYEQASLEELRKTLQLLVEQIYQEGLLSSEEKIKLSNEGSQDITLILDAEAESEKVIPVSKLRTLVEVSSFAVSMLPQTFSRNRQARRAILEMVEAVIQPNLIENEGQTAQRRKEVIAAVTPIEDSIKKDELIAQRGRRITLQEKQRIDQIQKKLAEREILDRLSGIALLVFLIYILVFLYLYYFEKKTFASMRMILLMHAIFIMTAAICKVISQWPGSSPYLMPTALAPLLLTLLAPVGLGILGSAVMAVFAALLTGFQPDVILGTLAAGFAGTFSALRLRKRIEFIRLGVAVGATYFLVLFAFQTYLKYSYVDSLQIGALGLANGLLITIPLCFLVLPILEAIFNLVTDVSLLELSDLNHPLLKRMVVEAPGTYHHSLVVSTLAEAACERIGANALLARVGCYFHDIGKIAKAEYFTENQRHEGESRHATMSPSMSSFIIMNHVKGGIELGQKHKLKKSILDFIPEHHGTQVIYYFYRKALDSAKPGEKVSADDFRYTGPKPQSRETAVSLLADSTEAASRSLKDPTPDNLCQLVKKIINDKFIDGQLDECDLSLKDLHYIQESFVYNLMAIYHTRVTYPEKPANPKNPDLFKGDKLPQPRSHYED